ncbi:hypothetical protein, partial [Mesorhizobium sp.]|uniref:hypothetical protein n=1 Tax=Mesorhizobium sp. TaxID=1871066 RepID=UPI0025C0A569
LCFCGAGYPLARAFPCVDQAICAIPVAEAEILIGNKSGLFRVLSAAGPSSQGAADETTGQGTLR